MSEYRAAAKGFHNDITAVVEVTEGKVTSIKAENVSPNTVGAVGVEKWLNEANEAKSVEVDAISGASISTGALRRAAKAAFAHANGQEIVDATSGASEHKKAGAANGIPTPANYPLLKKRVYDYEADYSAEYDIVVVGSGGAGLAAAATAAENNASVLVIEKAGIAGGTTNYSGGVVQAAGTKWQKEFTKYQDDTPEEHEAEYLAAGEGRLSRELVHDFTQNAPKNMEWLANMGVKWTGVYGHTTIPYATDHFADRIHIADNGGGTGAGVMLTQHILKYALNLGAKVRYNTAVVGLIQEDSDNNEVTGVVVSDGVKLDYIKARRAVILATASIDRNVELAKDLSPQHYEDVSAHRCWSVKTDRGDGIVMGMHVGAAVTGFGGTIDFDARTGNGTSNAAPTIPSIFVNGNGLRFVNEEATYAYGFRAIFNEEKKLNKPTYQIFGTNALSEPTSPWNAETVKKDIETGLVVEAASIAELAKKIGVPAKNLERSVATWNENTANGTDPEYERTVGVEPITGTFYAYKNTPGNLGAIGGLKVNVNLNVLDVFNQPIPGLYAAGLNAGGWIGSYYPGSGTAIGGIIHQGRRTAKAILGVE